MISSMETIVNRPSLNNLSTDLTQNFFLKLSPNLSLLKNFQSYLDSMRKSIVTSRKQSTSGKKEVT